MGHIAPEDPRINKIPKSTEEKLLYQRLLAGKDRMKNMQCVSLAKLSVEDFRSVYCWRRGIPVLSERLPPGTPIATFLNREGEESELYDGGVGVGAPGNMTTHAAVLIDYIKGTDNEVNGILVFDQHALLSHFRRMIYPIDPSTFGTASATNYYTIDDSDGFPLGGTHNPIWNLTNRAA